MDLATFTEIKKRVKEGESPDKIRNELTNRGFLEDDVNIGLEMASVNNKKSLEKKETNRLLERYHAKEFFERLGYGTGSLQFLNILMFLSGSSYLFIGLINGIRTFFGVFISSILDEYHLKFRLYKKKILIFGFLYASTFIFMGIAKLNNWPIIFGISFLLGGLVVVIYGHLYQQLLNKNLSSEIRGKFLSNMNFFGLFITSVGLIGGGYLLSKNDGYITVLIISAVAFILSSLAVLMLPEKEMDVKGGSLANEIRFYFANFHEHTKEFLKDKIILVLLITGAITSFVQTLGASYYGIFIYEKLGDSAFGRYNNVAIIFFFGMLGSYIGSFISNANAKEYGKFPMLTFGTILIAIMPFTFFYNPNLLPVSMATVLGVIGSSIVGVARGLLTIELVPESQRKHFYKMSTMLITLPYIISIPIGAAIAEYIGLRTLFLILGIILVAAVVPLYFTIVLIHNKKRKI